MKNRFLPALVLAGLVAIILLLWFDYNPATEPTEMGGAELRSQVEPKENPRLHPGKGERDVAAQISAWDPDAAAAVNSFAAADVLASRLLKPAGVDRAAADLPDDEEPEEFVIGGHVQDEEGEPVSNIEVLAEWIGDANRVPLGVDLTPEQVQSIFTDFTGAFLFGNLQNGDYRLRLAPVAGIAPAEIKVRAGILNANLVAVVLRDVRVYGTVNSTDGAPIKDVHIVAAPAARSTITGSRGEYELDVNWQGNDALYTVLFQHEDFRQQRIRINSADLDDRKGDFQLNVTLEPLKRLVTVAGRLTDTNGSSVSGEILTMVTPQLRTSYQAQSDEYGNFLFKAVEPGKDHQLRIRPASRYKNKDINPLLVPDAGLTLDVVLELIDEGELSGWMIDLDGHAIPGFPLTLRSNMATAKSVSVVSDQQGFFSVQGFPVGDALLRTHSYPILMVQGIHVSADPEEPVTVILDTGKHVLLGRVIDKFGEPVAASIIILNWEFTINGLRNSSTRKTNADQYGNFVFTGLGPDLHALQVSAAGFSTAVHTIDVGTGPHEIVVVLEAGIQ